MLSHAERRALREMQHRLSTEDPEFVRRFDPPGRRRPSERRRRQHPRLILAEMVIALGIMDPNPLTDAQIAALMGIPAPRRSRP